MNKNEGETSTNAGAEDSLWDDDSKEEVVEPESEQENEPEADDKADKDIAETAKGQEGARKVSARLSKYRSEAESARDQALKAEQKLAEKEAEYQKLRGVATSLLKGFDVDNTDVVSGIEDIIATHAGKDVKTYRQEQEAVKQQVAAQMRVEELRKEQQRLANEAVFARDLAAIKARYPEHAKGIAHIKDLGPEFMAIMAATANMGKTPDPVEVFAQVKHREISETKEAAAKQSTQSAIAGKSHMRSSGGTPGTAVVVPKSVKDGYRLFNPKITDEDIAKDYQENLKFMKG